MAARVWVVGSAVVDTVYRVDAFPKVGESRFAASVGRFLGGKGSNQAVASARAGAATSIVGCLGTDPAGREFLAAYEAEGIDVSHVVWSDEAPTGSASIVVDDRADNQITIYPGANLLLGGDDFPSRLVGPEDIVVCQLEVTDEVVLAASRQGRFVFNPAPHRAFPAEALARAYVVTPNETEAAAMTGILPEDESSCRACAESLARLGPQNIVLTLGDRGAFWSNGSESAVLPAPQVVAVDPTGAGDVFTGVLAALLCEGASVPDACRLAVRAASISVTRPGAIPSVPYRAELG